MLALSLVAFGASCSGMLTSLFGDLLPESFGPEYDDVTINFIAGLPLKAPSVSADAEGGTALDPPAAWDWAWRGQAGNGFEYMSMSDAGAVGTAVSEGGFTLASEEMAWRLELNNLAGDPYFEGSVPAGWVQTGTAALSTSSTTLSHGRYLTVYSYQDDWAGFDPNAAGFMLDSPADNRSAVYRLFGNSTASSFQYVFGDYTQVANFDDTVRVVPVASAFTLDRLIVRSVDTRAMFAASGRDQSVEIDDIRVVRTDISGNCRLRIRLRPSDAYPVLAPGRYEFSVWIKRPADAHYPDATERIASPEAPFAAPKVRLELRQIGFSDNRETPIVFSGVYDTGPEWRRVALRMGDSNLERFERGSEDAVIELAVYPFASEDGIDAGSALIAAPSLRFFKGGYVD